jgi:molybdopterin-containing oxidoreductase family iron-sulfur binding subunit
MAKQEILVNINRCTGCWTCSLACKVGNKLNTEDWWQHVRTIGGSGAVDDPGGAWPHAHMKWMPVYTTKCVLCKGRTSGGDQPYCTFNCPTKALTYGDSEDPQSDFSLRKQALADLGFHFYRLPQWEESSSSILYAER